MADIGTITGAAPLNASNDTYTTFTDDLTQTLTNALNDTPADLGNVDTLNWTIEYSLRAARTDDTYALAIRIVNGATILAAADAGGTFVTVAASVTSTTDTTSGPTAFGYVNTGATKAQWDGASVELQQTYTKTKGADATAIRVDYFAVTGTYSVGVASATGTMAAVEAGSDTLAATGAVAISGVLTATETGNDTAVGAGAVAISGTLATQETGADTFAASGTVGSTGVTGSMAAVEAGSDTLAASGAVAVSGALSATETGTDTASATGTVGFTGVSGTMAAQEAGTDTLSATGLVAISASMAANESGTDTAVILGGVVISGAFVAIETGVDLMAANGVVGGADAVVYRAPASRTQAARAYGRSKAANQGARSETAMVKSRTFSVGERNNS